MRKIKCKIMKARITRIKNHLLVKRKACGKQWEILLLNWFGAEHRAEDVLRIERVAKFFHFWVFIKRKVSVIKNVLKIFLTKRSSSTFNLLLYFKLSTHILHVYVYAFTPGHRDPMRYRVLLEFSSAVAASTRDSFVRHMVQSFHCATEDSTPCYLEACLLCPPQSF